jgi:16S rRNA processing protein RimM
MNTHSKNENLRKVGKFLHAHGLRGELYLMIFSGDYGWFEDVAELYLESKLKDKKTKDNFQKYEIKSFRPHKEGILVTLAGVDNRNISDSLSGSEVWVSSDLFVSDKDDDKIFLVEIENFDVYDREIKIGTIVGFSYNGAQDLLTVKPSKAEINSGAVAETIQPEVSSAAVTETIQAEIHIAPSYYEIPFVEDFIEEIDYDKKQIIMHLPEGLIESQMQVEKTSSRVGKETK